MFSVSSLPGTAVAMLMLVAPLPAITASQSMPWCDLMLMGRLIKQIVLSPNDSESFFGVIPILLK
jgi:hypothetical protein